MSSFVIDWRRLLVAAPMLVLALFAVWWLAGRTGADAATPRAVLADPPPSAASADVGVRQGHLARDFIVGSPDGETFRLSDLRGKPVVVNFWATWCTSCLTEMPELAEVQREFGADNVHVLALNTGESSSRAAEFIDSLDAAAFYYGMDPTLSVTDAYGVFGLSTSVFIDADGVIRATYVGQLDQELMREYIRSATEGVDGRAPPPKLRLPGSVEARTSVLIVIDLGYGEAEFRSRRLRCDDTYCADQSIDLLGRTGGVLGIRYEHTNDPPAATVTFEPDLVSLEALASTLAGILEASEDPLYEHAVQLKYD